jgi:hypothetical protein
VTIADLAALEPRIAGLLDLAVKARRHGAMPVDVARRDLLAAAEKIAGPKRRDYSPVLSTPEALATVVHAIRDLLA